MMKNYWVVDFEKDLNEYRIYPITLECVLDEDTSRILHFFESRDDAERYIRDQRGN